MAPSSGEDYPLQGANLIDLDDYIKNPIFQHANKQDDGCVIDVGTVDNRLPVEVKTSPQEFKKCSGTFSNYCGVKNRNTYSNLPERRCAGDRRRHVNDHSAPYKHKQEGFKTSCESESSFTFQDSAISRGNRKQYSLDSGVSDGGHYSRRRSTCQSDVGWRGRHKGGGHRARNRGSHDVGGVKSQSSLLDTLKQQQAKIDRLTALCEECLQPKRQRKSSQSRDSSTSELSSSLSEDVSPRRRQDKHKKTAANECKTYKIIMRKLDELNQHFVCKQPERARLKSSSESKTASESVVVVSDKAVCTDTPKNHKPKTVSARNEARAKLQLPKVSTSSSVTFASKDLRKGSRPDTERSRRRIGSQGGYEQLEGVEDLDPEKAKRVLQIFTALAKSDFEPSGKRSGADQANLYGINNYNLNDPISFYNQSKRLGPATAPPTSQSGDLCTLCRALWSRIRTSDILCRILCCGDGYALSNLTKDRNY